MMLEYEVEGIADDERLEMGRVLGFYNIWLIGMAG